MRWRWHPVLFAVYPVVFLFARNSGDLPAEVLWRPLGVALGFGLVVWAVARRVAGDGARGALLATGFLMLWSVYGHVHEVLEGSPLGQHRVLLPVWIGLVVWIVLSVWNGRPDDARTRILSRTATLIGILLLAGPLYLSIPALIRERDHSRPMLAYAMPNRSIDDTPEPACPNADIYHIVLDGYGRADVLSELYGIDDTAFLDALRDRGFCVVDSARANYMQTLPAIAVAMGEPVDFIDQDPMDPDRGPLVRSLKQGIHFGVLRRRCAWSRAFATGYFATEMLDADRYLAPPTAINEFERALIAATPAGVALNLVEAHWGDVLHRRTVEYAFAHLAVGADDPPRAFTFAHIVAPHPPFVFAPPSATAGAMVPLADGDHVVQGGGLTVDQYRAAYRAQIEAVNVRLLRAVDAILANGRESVILLHGDHGPGSLLKWEQRIPDPAAARERLGVLLAVRFPGPVNDICEFACTPAGAAWSLSWRMDGFVPDPDVLPSRYSTWTHPFDFVEIAPDGTPVAP